jgi:hypothetical protein
LAKQRLVAQVRNRNLFDEVFAQDGHFLLRGELSAGLSMAISLDAPTLRLGQTFPIPSEASQIQLRFFLSRRKRLLQIA